jgi:pimeloyl-ACP methyl ester carboxylesterase
VSETRFIDFDGHRVAYRVAGEGPALVVLHLYRRREPLVHLRVLSDRRRVFEISPIGFGRSDRVPGYAGELLVDQVQTVLDEHDVDRFVIWGYSAGGSMAACVARATPRVAGLICGGFALSSAPTPGVVRQMEKRLPPDSPSRSQWSWHMRFDRAAEMRSMPFPQFFFWGSEDTSLQMAKRLRRIREQFADTDIDFVEFPGVGHEVGGNEQLLTSLVFPAVTDWLDRRMGAEW